MADSRRVSGKCLPWLAINLPMQRILIIGSGGAGKSTLARELAQRKGLPVIHLDRHFWRDNWVEPDREVWAAQARELIAADAWVMDGNYGGTMDMRIERADTIIFLAMSRWLCMYRVIKRRLRFHKRSRPDMNPNCREQLNLKFLLYLFHYPKSRKPGILQKLARVQEDKTVFILHNRREVHAFLQKKTDFR